MKFLIYAIGLAIVSLIIKSLRTLKNKGYETTSSILKFNFLLIIPAVLAGGFIMSRFYTSPFSAKFEKSTGDSDFETIITDKTTGNQFTLPCEYSEVEFGRHLDVVTSGFGEDLQVYNSKGSQMTGIIPVLFRNSFLSFWIVFIIIEGLGNYLWIRRVVLRKPVKSHEQEPKPENKTENVMEEKDSIQYVDLGLPSGTLWADRDAGAEGVYKLGLLCEKAQASGSLPTHEQEPKPENKTENVMEEKDSIQYVDLGLPSGTLWADRDAGAEGVYKLGLLCEKAQAPGSLPTYDQCAELINECDFSSCLVPDENNIMKNFINVEGPNKNAIFFPCIRPDEELPEIGAYCWCADGSGEYSYFMMLQQRLLGLLDFAEITNLTIGMTLKSEMLMVRNVKCSNGKI